MSRVVHTNIWSAYGYARKAGYEGTEEEFEQGLKKSAEAAGNAEESASTASEAATEAKAARDAAAQSAESASTSEGNALEYANSAAQVLRDAQAVAQTVNAKATEAAGSASRAENYAQTATTKASEATTAAGTATSAASSASGSAHAADASATAAAASETNAAASASSASTSAGSASESADEAAASAAAAQEVKDSIPADYTALSDEVTDLKSEINSTNEAFESFPNSLFIRGQVNPDGSEGTYYQNRIKFSQIQNTGGSLKYFELKDGYGAWFSIYDENNVFQWRSKGIIDYFVLPENTNFKVEIAKRGETDTDHSTPADIALYAKQLLYKTKVNRMITAAYQGKLTYTLLDVDMEMGTLTAKGDNDESTYNKTRKMRTVEKLFAPANTIVTCKNNELTYMVYIFGLDKNFISATTWLTEPYTIENDSYIRIQFKLKNDAEIIENQKTTYREGINIDNNTISIMEKAITDIGDALAFIRVTSNGQKIIRNFNSFAHEYGTFTANGENNDGTYNKTRKIRSTEWIYLNKGDIFKTDSSLLKCYAISIIEKLLDANTDVNSGWITSSYTIPFSGLYRLQFSLRSDGEIAQDIVEDYSKHIIIESSILDADYKNLKQINDSLTTGRRYAYTGPMLNFNKTTYNMTALPDLPTQPSGVTAREASAYYNGVLFKFYANDIVQLIDYNTSEVIATITSGTAHANSASFSNEFYDSSDEFPLCYVGSDNSENDIYVIRITRNDANIIRTIKIPVAEAGYHASNSAIDINNAMLWTTGYVRDDFLSPENNNGIYLCSWSLNSLTDNDDGSYTPSLISKTLLPFIDTTQDEEIYGGNLYILSSSPYASSNRPTKLYVISLDGKRISNVLTEFYEYVHDHECEGLVFVERGDKYIIQIDTVSGKRMELLF